VRVGQLVNGVATYYFMGGAYEVTGTSSGSTFSESSHINYFAIAGQLVASDSGSGLQYFLTDHLGSMVAVLSDNGALLSQQRYMPFGQVRNSIGSITQTDFGYTGQRNEAYTDLMDYRSRWYDPELGRFVSPDSIIPNLANPQSLNRYSYVLNRPLIFNDPTGHMMDDASQGSGCNTPGSPKCILDKYYGASTESQRLEDLELIYYKKAHLDYDVNTDPNLSGAEIAIVIAPTTRAGCASGSTWNCFAMAIVGGMGTTVAGPTAYNSEVEQQNAPPSFNQNDAVGDPDCAGCGYQTNVKFPSNEGQVRHIFRDKEGHFATDTAMNRALLVDTVQNQYYIETDPYGNQIYAQRLDNSTEVWVEVRNGGLNLTPIHTK